MSVFSSAGKNIMLDAVGLEATSVRIHIGDPGAAGTANAGTATAQTPTWAAAAAGEKALSATLEFADGGASEAATWFSIWGSTNTVFLGRGQITTGDVAFNAAGVFRLTTGTKMVLTDPV